MLMQILQFKLFIKTKKLDEICIFNSINDHNKKQKLHSIQFPDNKKHIDILREFIKTN